MSTPAKPKRVQLDLGSGEHPARGFRGIDLFCGKTKKDRVDLFEFPWPWEDSSVDFIRCSHFIEHVPSPEWEYEYTEDGRVVMRNGKPVRHRVYPWVQFVDELWRVLKPGGQAMIVHPNLKSVRAFQDPTHEGFIPLERWLMYVQRETRQANGLDHRPYPTCDFHVQAGLSNIHPSVEMRQPSAQEQWATLYWDAAGDVTALLTAIKDSPEPVRRRARAT